MKKQLMSISTICFLIFCCILYFLICGCSNYHLYVVQIVPPDKEKNITSKDLREPEQTSTPAIGDMSKAPNRNFTDVRNWGNLLYIAVDTQTPKVVSTNASVPVTLTPLP